MFRSKYLAAVAACAALTLGSVARADDPAPVTSDPLHPYMLDITSQPTDFTGYSGGDMASAGTNAGTRPLLMTAFDGLGGLGKGMDDLHLRLGGYVEGSWTYDTRPQDGNFIAGRIFDSQNESIQFDGVQLDLTRQWSYYKDGVDFGFTIENNYGWDAAFLHSNGISIYSPGTTASRIPGSGGIGYEAFIHPKAQYDLTQAFGVLTLPVGNGLGIQFGKFDKLLGIENIEANETIFFSRSFIFQQEPFTHTGALLIYNITRPNQDGNFSVAGGISRGWEQATNDDNGSIDYMGELKFKSGAFDMKFSGVTGDEEPSGPLDGWRTVLDLDSTFKFADNFKFSVDAMYAWQAQAGAGGAGGGVGQWYGVAGYLSYMLPGDVVEFNARGEWFNDPDGAAPTQYLNAGFSPAFDRTIGVPNEYFEATVGLNITPVPASKILSGLHIRPEFRWDYADHATWNAGTQHDQWTASVEAYFTF